jgi:hypothetical protein
MRKRVGLAAALAVLLLAAAPVAPVAYANSPAPIGELRVEVNRPPEDAVYVDVLIKIDPEDADYIGFSDQNGTDNAISADAGIVAYNEDGYMSLSFHRLGMQAFMTKSNPEYKDFRVLFIMPQSMQTIDDITSSLKVALLDGDANVIHVSDAIDVSAPSGQYARTVFYDVETLSAEVEFVGLPPYGGGEGGAATLGLLALVLLLLVGRVALSIGSETLIAITLHIKPVYKVVLVNIATQIALIAFMGLSGMTYVASMAIGEAAVYIVEGVAFCLLYRDIKPAKVIAYTVVANTVSLAIGLVMNYLGTLL